MADRSRPVAPSSEPAGPVFRSAAVARMAHMPVATLRIWEQRYGAVQPATSPSGHRWYSAADVQRVLLLRQLTERGHAIGSIAGLDAQQLQLIAQGLEPPHAGETPGLGLHNAPLRMVVVGPALALRLQRDAVLRRLHLPPRLVSVFDTLDEAVQARTGLRADVLLWHAPELQQPVPAALLAAARDACQARQLAVVYRFGSAAATQALVDLGAQVTREPAGDDALGGWLHTVAAHGAQRDGPGPDSAPPVPHTRGRTDGADTPPPRRFNDAELTALAGLDPQLACECPRHVAELLMQLASFESYSAGCVHRNEADAELHAYLHRMAGAARVLFEDALVRVARHEGLALSAIATARSPR